jgi:1-acyl-sn-glycerol-3-phosphate acyltransferase
VSVVPVGIAYVRRDGMPLGRLGRAEVAWYGDMEFLPHFWKLLRHGGIDCEVRYGAPIRFGRTSERKAVASHTEAAVRRLLSREFVGQPQPEEVSLPNSGPFLPEMTVV